MIRTWLERGVDGFRLDIFGSIMHDAQLRNNGPRPSFQSGLPRLQDPVRTLNTEECFELATELRAVCDEFEGDRVLLGEVFGPRNVLRLPASPRAARAAPGVRIRLPRGALSGRHAARADRALRAGLPGARPADARVGEPRPHAQSVQAGRRHGKARVMATLLLTLRGVPVIYQGQEIGMTNRYIPLAEADDPIPAVVARACPRPSTVGCRSDSTATRCERRCSGTRRRARVLDPRYAAVAPRPRQPRRGERGVADRSAGLAPRVVPDAAPSPTSASSAPRGALRLRPFDDGSKVIVYERIDGTDRLLVVANLGDDRVTIDVPNGFVAAPVERPWNHASTRNRFAGPELGGDPHARLTTRPPRPTGRRRWACRGGATHWSNLPGRGGRSRRRH